MDISRERKRQLRQNAKGLCSVASCKRKMDSGGRCKAHAAKMGKAILARYHATKGAVKVHNCGKCGEPGHNRATCPRG